VNGRDNTLRNRCRKSRNADCSSVFLRVPIVTDVVIRAGRHKFMGLLQFSGPSLQRSDGPSFIERRMSMKGARQEEGSSVFQRSPLPVTPQRKLHAIMSLCWSASLS
jgi:hypothetical protein